MAPKCFHLHEPDTAAKTRHKRKWIADPGKCICSFVSGRTIFYPAFKELSLALIPDTPYTGRKTTQEWHINSSLV
jgi:hypothetical protein